MKLLRIIFIITICINFPIFAENLESVTTTEDIENDVFIPLDENHPVLNQNYNINNSSEFKNYANGKIIVLNKITATSKEMNFTVGEEQYFGNIKIKLHKCIKNLDPYNEDNYLLMTITEYKIDEDPNLLFQGWMTSSSISLSTFEHPIYEIFAKDCF
ncbi:DUF2155 domain-containing protein [Rickettsia canadensis]|uniref:DUF2155 domain-containing protein n=1 Tax=Rickettsia canadensis str. CA410 TaxID=1105107 RepID=A0ABM5MTU9_RICCA|nr:DUF2155 domain-containing protein [Rickettsia canadensis]AFB21227.1 hypothetical protein RCA_03320 [Rickettsia canadensis str. CA410]